MEFSRLVDQPLFGGLVEAEGTDEALWRELKELVVAGSCGRLECLPGISGKELKQDYRNYGQNISWTGWLPRKFPKERSSLRR